MMFCLVRWLIGGLSTGGWGAGGGRESLIDIATSDKLQIRRNMKMRGERLCTRCSYSFWPCVACVYIYTGLVYCVCVCVCVRVCRGVQSVLVSISSVVDHADTPIGQHISHCHGSLKGRDGE